MATKSISFWLPSLNWHLILSPIIVKTINLNFRDTEGHCKNFSENTCPNLKSQDDKTGLVSIPEGRRRSSTTCPSATSRPRRVHVTHGANGTLRRLVSKQSKNDNFLEICHGIGIFKSLLMVHVLSCLMDMWYPRPLLRLRSYAFRNKSPAINAKRQYASDQLATFGLSKVEKSVGHLRSCE